MTAGDSPSETDDVVAETVSLLGELGLTEYEAKCLVALVRIDRGTAKEVAAVADVPRARVYDSMDSLQEDGLVDVQGSQPRRYRAIGAEPTVQRFRREFASRCDRLAQLLPQLSAPESRSEAPGVWTLEGERAVTDRLVALVDDATGDLTLVVAIEALLTDELLDALVTASERGVDVTVASPAPSIRAAVDESVSDATVQETWTWWETHPIQPGEISAILLADGQDLLVSSTLESDLPDVRRHAAVWTDDEDAPVVGLLQPLLEAAITGERTMD